MVDIQIAREQGTERDLSRGKRILVIIVTLCITIYRKSFAPVVFCPFRPVT